MSTSTPASSFPSISNDRHRGRRAAFPWAAAALLSLAGCAGSRIPHPTARNVELAERNGQVTTLAALKVGRSLFISRCAGCHTLRDPGMLGPKELPDMVQRMSENAKLNEDQQRVITQYLVGVSAALHEDAPAGPAPADPGRAPVR